MTSTLAGVSMDGHRVRRLDLIDVDALEGDVVDRRRRVHVADLIDLITWCRWLFAVRARQVEFAQQLHADGQLTDFGLRQLLRMADWNANDAEYLNAAQRSGDFPRFWRLVS